ncbi:MAG: saccharopine dehydrogenase NADP-binding domain-containing protein [Pseudomonadaceae bacterium]|nr:saccharopine dehydrogenase NADP-binding domain-containing protein [Pseudomonadaceae bacterium]
MDERIRFDGRLVLIGFGCIGQAILPLLLRHIDFEPQRMLIVSLDTTAQQLARDHGIAMLPVALPAANYREQLRPHLGAGDFLLNLSVAVSSEALIRLCHGLDALYLDTCTEPWPGGYDDPALPLASRTNYALRESMLALRRELGPGPTALLTHGANPGLISHLLKQALLELANDLGLQRPLPVCREDWAGLARDLGVRSIHIAERDTQYCLEPKRLDEFANTWSAPGFISEACQPAELGWGSHERHFPVDGRRHAAGCRAAIYLTRPGASTRLRSWTPLAQAQLGVLITHVESISIADYFTLGDPAMPDYRPTVAYVYHPCDAALLSLHELAGRNWRAQSSGRVLRDELVDGVDALGVLLMGHARGAYWYGSRLSLQQARALCPYNNATSLQVAVTAMAGVIWAMENPRRGMLEPD